jgi:hypothetical protein
MDPTPNGQHHPVRLILIPLTRTLISPRDDEIRHHHRHQSPILWPKKQQLDDILILILFAVTTLSVGTGARLAWASKCPANPSFRQSSLPPPRSLPPILLRRVAAALRHALPDLGCDMGPENVFILMLR